MNPSQQAQMIYNIKKLKEMIEEEQLLVVDTRTLKQLFPFSLPKPIKKGTMCKMCGSRHAFNRHHLIPKSVWKKGDKIKTIPLCYECHTHLHTNFSNYELRRRQYMANKISV
jgi:hypothetical protein